MTPLPAATPAAPLVCPSAAVPRLRGCGSPGPGYRAPRYRRPGRPAGRARARPPQLSHICLLWVRFPGARHAWPQRLRPLRFATLRE